MPQALESIDAPPPARVVDGPITPAEMLNSAISKGASIEVIEKLMAMHERMEAAAARKAFDAAIAEAKSEIPTISKNREVDYTPQGKPRVNYRYEDLAEIARTVSPLLAKQGLSYRFRASSNLNEPVSVTCIVSHRDGYSEETTLTAPRDEGAGKNGIQAIGSTLTYLQRMTLKAALGLAAEQDDDGATAETPAAINDQQRQELADLLDETAADESKFLAFFEIEFLAELPSGRFAQAKQMLEAKRK